MIMKGLSTITTALGLLSTCTEGLVLQKRVDGPPRVVGFPVERIPVSDPVQRDRLRRRDVVQVTLDNQETLYFANATLGTPPQQLRLHLDTGSSDLWVNTPESRLCTSRRESCAVAGTYDANSSSTYEYIASDFNISYVDGTGASGDYVSDTLTFGSSTLKRLQFGVGYVSTAASGILGIGYKINEVQVGRAKKSPYNNLPAQLVVEGLIQTNAFSLWLNDLDASTGSILFGGVDTERFKGELATLPVQAEQGEFAEFLVTMTGISFGSSVIAANQAQAVLLDSGSSLSYLPDPITAAIYEKVGAQYDSSDGVAYVPCTLGENTTTLDFSFSGPTIAVPMDELIIAVTTSNGRPLMFADGSRACVFGIAPAGSSTAVMGDTFMRSAYIVYDLANNEISIAQTNFNATKSNILEIAPGSAAIPMATRVANPVAASAGIQRDSVAGTVTLGVGAAKTSKGGAERTGAPMNIGAMAAVGVGMVYAAM